MKTERPARIQDLVGLIHALYPSQLAEDWDNVGLHVGDPTAPLTRVLIALDPTEAALSAACEAGAQALLTHHPLIFHPLKSLTPASEAGRTVLAAVKAGIAVLCAHTNLDRAADGLNDWLAERLGVGGAEPLLAGEGDLLKLVVFVPVGYEEAVAAAAYRGGAGQIGRYDSCSFQTPGIGTYRPGEGTQPFIGSPGSVERAREVRLETIVPRERLAKVLEKVLAAHPYEETAYDLIPLGNRRPGIGLGRIGRLADPLSLEVFARRVREALGTPCLRVVGELNSTIVKIALCGGSGGSLIGEAARRGADVLVTGDIKYHEARQAEALGLVLVDPGHFGTERIAVPGLKEKLQVAAGGRGLAIDFIEMEGETDPFRIV